MRDPLDVGGGSAGAHLGLSTVVQLSGEKPAMGVGTGGRQGCRVVGDGLCIRVELVGTAVGPSVARGRGAHGGAHSGSGGGDLAAEAWAGGRWCQLGVREAAWRCLIAWGGALGGEQRLEARYSTEKRLGASGSKAEQSRRRTASRGAQQ
jgi:hypothetical protein